MKIGISTACFYGKEHVEDTFDIIKDMGAEVAEVFLNTFSEYEKPFAEQLVERKNGLKIHSIHAHGTCFEPELFAAYDRIRDDAEAAFKKVCYAGFLLGAKYYTFHGPFQKVNRSAAVDYPRIAERLNRLIGIAESYGIQIAFENVNWCMFSTPEFFKQIKPLCPGLKATFDVKQAVYSDIDPYRFLDAIGDRLVTLHLCGMEKGNLPVLPPEGRINFSKLLRAAYEINPEVNALIEVYHDAYRDYNELKECYRSMCNLLDEVLR